MKKITLIVIAMLLVTGASGAYGYFFIYESDNSSEDKVEQIQETNETVEEEPEEPEEPEDPPAEDNNTFFRGLRDECFEHNGVERCWILYVPERTDETQSVPLIFDLHGLERTAQQQYNMTDMDRIARENNAIIVYPQGFGNSWNFRACCDPAREEGIDDFGFIRTLAQQMIEDFPIDSNRIYSTGWSNGCAMSQALANEESDLITAIACMSMYFIGDQDSSYSAIPVMEIHGFLDPIAPYAHVGPTGFFFQQEVWNTGAVQNMYTWKEMNSCSGNSPDLNEQEVYYNIQSFTDCDNGSEVTLVTLHAGTHNVYVNDDTGGSEPGNQGTVDTAQIAWDFMSRFSK